jgi:hypothetical protein
MIAAKPDRRLIRPEPSAAPTAALRSPDDRLDEYHRKIEASGRELASELDPGTVAELNVHDKAIRLAGRSGAQKGFG